MSNENQVPVEITPTPAPSAVPVETQATQLFDIFSNFATDPKLELEGAWFDLAPGARVKVARADNPKFSRMLKKLLEEHNVELGKDDDAADARGEDIMARVFAGAILRDFEGPNFAYKGKVVTYSPEMALEMLRHKGFRLKIGEFAQSFNAYKAKLEEDQGKA